MDRQFIPHPDIGYTLPCPAGCENSFIEEIHHFKLLTKEQYERYQRFATEEYVLQVGGVLCPQPGCGMGLIVDPECRRVQCQNGCGVSCNEIHFYDLSLAICFVSMSSVEIVVKDIIWVLVFKMQTLQTRRGHVNIRWTRR